MSMRLSLSIVCAVLFLAYFDPFASAGSFFRLRSEPPVPVPHQVATPFCPEPPNAAESVLLASQSPVVLAGRLRQRVSLAGSQPSDETDHLFNLSVLVTMQYKTAGVQSAVDGVINVGVFFTPSHNSNGGPGCLDVFYPNSKYIFFLRPSDDRSKFFELTGRPATYTEELEHIIFAQQCSKCYAPIVNSLSNQQVKHGDRLSVTCSASGYPVPQIVWIKNGQSINLVDKGVHIENVELPDGKTESLLEIVKLVRVDAGEYECRAKNPLGTASAKFALQVTQTEKEEQQLMSTELVPCTEEQRYYCMNGGQCYMFKADRDVFQCRCPQQYFGDRCNFHVFGLLPYGEARDANLESMFKEISHEIIAHLTWSIWGSFALLAALLLFVIIKKHERLSKKSPRKQKAISTSSPKVMKNKNGALSNPLIHVSESNHILTQANDMNRLDTGVTSVMHEMEYLRPTNNQRTDRMQPTLRRTLSNRTDRVDSGWSIGM